MHSFDLLKTSQTKVNVLINKEYGGKYSSNESWALGGIGIGGFSLFEENEVGRKRLRGNFELLKNGLALYLRNIDKNLIFLWSWDEIVSISITKKKDILVRQKPSAFSFLYRMGLNYHYARIFLLDREMIEDHKTFITINLQEFESIVLEVTRFNPLPIVDVFKKVDRLLLHNDIETYQWS